MDPIADMFSQIINTYAAGKVKARVPFSGVKMTILEVFKQFGKIKDFKKMEIEKRNYIEISLLDKEIYINRMSRPGRRLYVSNNEIPWPKKFKGLVVVSTPEGIMSDNDARKKGVGGEVICEIA